MLLLLAVKLGFVVQDPYAVGHVHGAWQAGDGFTENRPCTAVSILPTLGGGQQSSSLHVQARSKSPHPLSIRKAGTEGTEAQHAPGVIIRADLSSPAQCQDLAYARLLAHALPLMLWALGACAFAGLGFQKPLPF